MRDERPVIGFLTDFGFDGAAATCRGVMLSICRDAQIVDISHAVPKYGIAAGAFILRSALPFLPVGVHVAVVDPGVGTERRPIAIRTGRGDVLIGPDNGLLMGPADALGGIREARELTNRDQWLPVTTATFHGRDIFSPVAAHLAAGTGRFDSVGPPIDPDDLVRLPQAEARVSDGRLETEVTYVDSFGNVRLAGGGQHLDDIGSASPGALVEATFARSDQRIRAALARSFGGVATGEVLLYVDSSGNLALAENQGNLAETVNAAVGDRVVIEPLASHA